MDTRTPFPSLRPGDVVRLKPEAVALWRRTVTVHAPSYRVRVDAIDRSTGELDVTYIEPPDGGPDGEGTP